MKLYKDIHKALINNSHMIDDLNNNIKALEYSDEIHAAIEGRNISRFKELNAAAKDNAGAVAAIKEKILLLQVENKFLQVNEKAALFAENIPAIIAAFSAFEGHVYGEKTAAKIREELKRAGLSVSFSRYLDGSANNISIRFLDKDGYLDYSRPEIHAYTDHAAPVIDRDNKIRFSGACISISEKYTENPKKAAKDVLKAFKVYQAATEKAGAAQQVLNDLKPWNMNAFHAVDVVYRLL